MGWYNFIPLFGIASAVAFIVVLVLAIVKIVSFWWVLLPLGLVALSAIAFYLYCSWALS